ncbi:IPT/TIG domain-containing protein [Psychroserpens damuponensis]|uniref:IPT/TIG domain-containing protein n=1 Tax=Psychroserpens damuponensis TaxID=943936 RepID=UPI0006933B45|nr:IPT/TIG domain-containing protein [Psychroserpens damuponensis]
MKKLTLIMLSVVLAISSCSKNDDGDNVAAPTLTTITPNNGPKGTLVTINGDNFGADASAIQVYFNEIEAEVQSVTNTAIEAIVPSRAYTGVVKVMVNNTELLGPEFSYTITRAIVDTMVGSDLGNADGQGVNVQFNNPRGIVFDSQGHLYVVDNSNHSIRKVTASGVTTTFAGSTQGFADGIGTSAKFDSPGFIAIDAQDNLYVTDLYNHKIRKITPDGEVSTFAGSTQGNEDGIGTEAKFFHPMGITIDADGNLYVSDTYNHNIRKITPTGEVTTLAGSEQGFADAVVGTEAKFQYPHGLAIDKNNNILVADRGNNGIRKISAIGSVTTITGSTQAGYENGPLGTALFNDPIAIEVDEDGNLYITDTDNHVIRKVDNYGQVSTFAGSTLGNSDGIDMQASFNRPFGITKKGKYKMYVSDSFNHRIRRITQE